MKGINSLEILIEDIEESLDMIFLIGINSIDNKTIEEFKNLSKECNKFGLAFAGENTQKIAEELQGLKGSFNRDKSTCIKRICALNEYLESIKMFKNS